MPIREIRVAADVPAEQRTALEVLRTDTQTFTDLIEARRNRQDEWYKYKAGRIDVCNVPLVVRAVPRENGETEHRSTGIDAAPLSYPCFSLPAPGSLRSSSSRERPMISCMISLLPARMRLMRAPVYMREIGYSSM